MSKKRKNPAPKTTKPAPKKGATTTDAAPKDAAATTPTTPAAREPKPRDPRLPAPGATLDREYKGKNFRLTFLDEGGVEVGGKIFGSLSAAARHITGAASINGFLWAGLLARGTKAAKTTKPATPSLGSDAVDLSTPEGQRAALAAAGITRRGRPIGKPRGDGIDPTATTEPATTVEPKPRKGTPEQAASAAKARAARAAKKAERTAR
jgi:hypothetical protein